MKRVLLFFAFFAFIISVSAQNIQTHYDFGKDRGFITTTVEMFKPDKMGNTFFFIDFDYGIPGQEHMSNAYFEIARVMKLGKTSPFGWHGEYNGGFGKIPHSTEFFTVNNAWFTGFADFWKEDSDFNFDGTTDATWTFLSEPQLWFNATEHFAFGSEVELSS